MAAKKDEVADQTKCESKFSDKWTKIEDKADGACPTNGDAATILSTVSVHNDEIVQALKPVIPPVIECDAVAQDCQEIGDGCFPKISDPYGAICAVPFLDGGTGQQGVACNFLNGCAIGYGCILLDDPVASVGLDCAFLCDADNSDANLACSPGPGSAFECRRVSEFYADVTTAPSDLGLCVDPLEWSLP